MKAGYICVEVRAADGEIYGYGTDMPRESFLRFDGAGQAALVEFLVEGVQRTVIRAGTWIGPDASGRGRRSDADVHR